LSALSRLAKAERLRRLRASGDRAAQQAAYLAGLSDKQLAVIRHPARVKTIRTGRRGGKTYLIARWLHKVAQDRAGALCLFVALTRPSAKRLIWAELRKIDKLYGLGCTFNGQELTVTHPNGSQIWLAGATRGPEIEKLRGHAYDLVCTDESGSFGEEFEYLLSEVLDAALEDYAGTLAMFGTPNAAAAGAFFDRDTSTAEHIAHFHWTVLDNPMFPRWAGKKNWRKLAAAWWSDKVKREGWQPDDPVMHREWLAGWVRDANRLVYRTNPSQCIAALPPNDDYVVGLGGDLGWNDQKTIQVLFMSTTTNKLYYGESFARSQMLVDDYAAMLKDFIKRYNPLAIVCDAGAIGKDIVEQLRQVYAIPVIAAQKTHKAANIQFLNADLKNGRVKFLPEAKPLFSQMSLLQWADKYQLKTDQAFREDLCDAGLYIHRYAVNTWKPREIASGPAPGSKEALDAQQAAAKAAALRRVRQAKAEGDPDHEFAANFERN
jgi:hypothetical protein